MRNGTIYAVPANCSRLAFKVDTTMRLTHEQRILRLEMRMAANRQEFDELRKLGKHAKCRACIRRDRILQKRLQQLRTASRAAQ
jgi:hypothetical protein